MKDLKLPLALKLFIAVCIIGMLYSAVSSLVTFVYSSTTVIYNQSVNYKLDYAATVENQVTTWDNNYLAFKDKYGLADISKETFVKVTQIIMQARTDGPNVAWKWAHENQNIDYEQFTSFYRDLSAFTAARFAENNNIERQKQDIVRKHNLLLTTFPGIIYNHYLKLPLLEYNKGFVSDETRKLFKLK